MKKSLLTLCVLAALLLSPTASWAKHVSADQAKRVAATFLQGIGCKQAGNIVDRTAQIPFTQFYLFAADKGGFVLVSADDCVMPILGYSATNRFDTETLPAHVADWLGGYEEQIAYFVRCDEQQRASGLRCGSESQSPVTMQWRMLTHGQMPPAVQNTSVAPLMTTTWNQSPRYNNLCPADNGHSSGHAVAGCTAIATAQVMKYWNHPAQGYGSHSYLSDYGLLSANFNTSYNWSNMPNSLSSSSTTTQINAVATLVYHVGVAVEMDYSANGSGARTNNFGDLVQASAENALKYYFKYKSSMQSIKRADYTPAEFATILTNELVNSRPIIFTGYDTDAGHAFVLDGVNNSGDFHVNWGWGGYCDGYYTMGALNPSTGGTGGNTSGTYNIDNCAIIGIQPNTSFSTTASTSVTGTSTNSSYGSVTGSGSYSFGDTVVLCATATSGNRFLKWNDGAKLNPRSFIATGGSYTFSATYDHLSGDTLGYATTDNWLTSFGGNSNAYWGIKLPSSALTANHDLKKVQLFIAGAGSYTASIYVGALSNSPITQSFTATNAEVGTWKTIQLSTPIAINGNQDVWITFHNTDVNYPAALTYDCGNADGMLWGSAYQSINSSWHYTFMIRGIFEQSTTTVGDTISYCGNDSYETTIGAGGVLYWGIMMPSTMLTGRSALNAVKLYVKSAGTYQLRVSEGGTTAPGTTRIIQTAVFTDADTDQWKTITLRNALAIDNTQPLWVTFFCDNVDYPATCSQATSDFNGSWTSADGTSWGSLYSLSGGTLNYTWMIKCITSPNPPAPGVAINGPSTFATGTTQTFTASTNYPSTTFNWSMPGASNVTGTGDLRTAQWNTPGTYNIIVTASVNNTTVHDTLAVTVYSCAVTTLPYVANFDNGLECWSSLDYDNDGYGWEILDGNPASASYINNVGALTPDNWLISPAITLPQNATATLSWRAKGVDANYATEHYSVYISTTGTAPANFTSNQLYTGNSTGSWAQHSASLSAYAGQTVYIAFRHHNTTDMYWLAIDSIAITSVANSTYNVAVNCTGTGSGTTTIVGENSNLCGQSSQLSAGYVANYKFTPAQSSQLTHLYVNNVDRISEVSGSSSSYSQWSLTINANTTINPVFDLRSLTINATASNGGTVTGSGSYTYGSQVTLTATPSTGHHFTSWSVTNNDSQAQSTSYDNPFVFTATANMTIVANFDGDTYQIEITANDPTRGTVSGSGTYRYLDPVTATATPYSGYRFAGWSNGESYNPYTFSATQDLELQAIFLPVSDTTTYQLTVVANDPTMGSVTGSGRYAAGAQATITATPFSGYVFLQWDDGNTSANRTITVVSDTTLTAQFDRSESINEADAAGYMVYATGRSIVVRNAAHRQVRVYDISGRMVSCIGNADEEQHIEVTHGGIYFVVVSTDHARKVVVY